jgi:hypothetical protein
MVMVILPGVTSLRKMNTPCEQLFCREIPGHGKGICKKNGYSAGRGIFLRNGTYDGNYQLIDKESTLGITSVPEMMKSWMRHQLEECSVNFFQNLNLKFYNVIKMKNRPNRALIMTFISIK